MIRREKALGVLIPFELLLYLIVVERAPGLVWRMYHACLFQKLL